MCHCSPFYEKFNSADEYVNLYFIGSSNESSDLKA